MAAAAYDMFNAYTQYGTNKGDQFGVGYLSPGLYGDTSAAAGGGTVVDPMATAAGNVPIPEQKPGSPWNFGTDVKTDLGGGSGGGLGDWFTKNSDMVQLGIGAVGTAFNIWKSWEAAKLAKAQFKAEKEATNINLANQIMAYNTALEDKTRHRASFNELSTADSDAYLASHRLEKRQIA